MKATILKISHKPSKYGGAFTYIFLKSSEGKSYRTCIGSHFNNYRRWEGLCKVGLTLDGLVVKGNGLVDADSWPKLVVEPKKDLFEEVL